jgi:hypothetical protein
MRTRFPTGENIAVLFVSGKPVDLIVATILPVSVLHTRIRSLLVTNHRPSGEKTARTPPVYAVE